MTLSITDAAQRLAVAILNNINVMWTGPPGIGKSDGCHQAVNMIRNGDTITVNKRQVTLPKQKVSQIIAHLVTKDPTDFTGLACTVIIDGVTHAEFVPFGDLLQMMEADHLTVVLFDDLGQALPSVQAAAMQLVQARCLNGVKLSDHVAFVAATNRRADKAAVGGIITPLCDRFQIYDVGPDIESWTRWAITSGQIEDDVIGFVRWHEKYQRSGCSLLDWKPSKEIVNTPTFRGVHRMSDSIRCGLDSPADIAGSVGEAMAASYGAFQLLKGRIPDIDLLLQRPEAALVPNDPGVQYALLQALYSRVKKDASLMPSIVTYLKRFNQEGTLGTEKTLTALFVNDIDSTETANRKELLQGITPLMVATAATMARGSS